MNGSGPAGKFGSSATPRTQGDLWVDQHIEGCGLKQKLRDLKRQIDTEVVSARTELSIRQRNTAPEVAADYTKVIKEAQEEIMKEIDSRMDTMAKVFTLQKNENQRLSAQIAQLNQENCGLQQSMLSCERRIGVLEEE